MIQARLPILTKKHAKSFGPGATRSRRRFSLWEIPWGNRHPASGGEDPTAGRPTGTGRYQVPRPG